LHEPNDSRLSLLDEAATLAFAARLAANLKAGLLIYLHGDLGAGKTTLVRGVLQSLGYLGRVKSPTYTLLEQYVIGDLQLRHFDLYRFNDAEEWEAAGFRDEFGGANICLVEWPERAAELMPTADLELSFEILIHGRTLTLHANTDAGTQCLIELNS
jgi:tRNA threonylcarbamoyladenosine biosynthesis protein TsaE